MYCQALLCKISKKLLNHNLYKKLLRLDIKIFASEPNLCAFQLFKLYKSKLSNKIDSLWQKPRSGYINYIDNDWYEGRIVRRDTLECFMQLSIAKSVKIDGYYMNHSIRSTIITHLDNAGFEARHIMQLSSDKSESTIKEYSVKCPITKRKEMFDSLSNAIQPKKHEPSATVSKPDTTYDTKTNMPTFNIEPIDNFNTLDDAVLQELLTDFPTYNDENFNPNITAGPTPNTD